MTKILSNKSNIDLDYPICRPSLDLDFTQEVLDPRITFSRGSIGTRVNRNRLIETVSANQPRFDFDPVTGECKGLLIEESRSNLLTYSEDFSNANWSKSQSSIITTSIVAPNGSTAYKLVENTVSGVGHFFSQPNISKASNAVLTLTIFAKAAERQYLGLVINSSSTGFTNRYGAEFNLGNGTARNNNTAQGTYSSGSFLIQPYPNGWYRCTITCTTSTDAQSQVRIFTFRDANQWTSAASYAGDGTSGLYLWGAQLEQGAFPTSYIPTTASTVTRSADNASMTGTNFSSWYNQTEGTVFCVYKNNTTDFTTRKNVYSITSPNYAIELRSPNAGSSSLRFSYNGQFNSIPNQISASLNQRKTAFSFNQNKHYAYIDSVYVVPSNLNQLNDNTKNSLLIGNRLISATDYLNGTISRLTYYPRALKPNQLQFLTA